MSDFRKEFIYLFLERGREKRGSVASRMSPNRDLACNAGLCPDRESNRRPFGLRDDAQLAEPPRPGLVFKRFRSHALEVAVEHTQRVKYCHCLVRDGGGGHPDKGQLDDLVRL